MPPGYTTQQKAAIAQFQNFTSADKNMAIKVSGIYNSKERGGCGCGLMGAVAQE
jgi:hypothetical protein